MHEFFGILRRFSQFNAEGAFDQSTIDPQILLRRRLFNPFRTFGLFSRYLWTSLEETGDRIKTNMSPQLIQDKPGWTF